MLPRTFLVLAPAALAACGHLTATEAMSKLEDAVVDAVDRETAGARSAVLRVDAPSLGVEGVWAAGTATVSNGAAFDADTPFLSASVGKLFTATAVMALADRGELGLDDAVADWVDGEVLDGLPVDGDVEAITVRQLLSHHSGLPDPFDPSESKTNDGALSLFEQLVEDPDRAWTRDQSLAYLKDHYDPAGAPGDRFQYSDANYDLLGLVLEGATGHPFDQVVVDEVIAPLGLSHTWYHTLAAPPEGLDYADVWVEDQNLKGAASLTLDGAAGGLATTTGDLGVFIRALVDGAPVDLDALATDWEKGALHGGIDYGYGAWQIRPGGVFFLLGGSPDLVGVSGMTGAYVYYVPEWDAVISGTFNQTDWQSKHVSWLLSQVLPPLGRIE
ncbi:MAG: serine hydrolase domain-containing protein [Myxococcota bacterium]